MAKWNLKINLTSLTLQPPSNEALDRLLVEPVEAARFIHRTDRIAIDLGSGGGSPAIPLKIAAPWLGLVMVEVKTRKSAFLREVVRQLELKDVEVANSRYEELLTRVDLHEAADVVTMRAIRADRGAWSAIHALLKAGGRVLWFTSAEAARQPVALPFMLIANEPLATGPASRLAVLRKA